jgi:hypothetical protein
MVRKKSKEWVEARRRKEWVEARRRLEEPRHRYGAVEAALAAVFGADAAGQAGVLRGRLKHFQKLGLPGLKVGKGARVRYSDEHAAQWLIALFLNDLGVEPKTIVGLFENYWQPDLVVWVVFATDKEATNKDRPNPVLLAFRPQSLWRRWQWGKIEIPIFVALRRWDPYPRENIARALDDLPEYGPFTVFNLTDSLVKLSTALKSEA